MSAKPVLLHFKFDNFANLPSEVGSYVFSDEQTACNGNKWKLRLFPGGQRGAAEQGYIGLFLHSCNTESIEAKHNLSIINDRGVCALNRCNTFRTFDDDTNGWGDDLFKKRSDILDPAREFLKDGALCIDATIQVKPKKYDIVQPQSPHSKNMLRLLKSSEDADVSFTVGTQTFLAHSIIIKASSPILANYCNRTASLVEENDSIAAKSIEDISPKAFQIILEHIYSGNFPTNKDAIKYDKELINAANKYDLVELKMTVENILVQECVMTKENVSEYIVFADSKCCPLLKEYALSYFVLHCKDILKSEHSQILRESGELLSEIIILTGLGSDAGIGSMSVAQLRKELRKRKLDLDGSKESLVSRLEEAKRQKTA
jgi:speckle-type POZ protein